MLHGCKLFFLPLILLNAWSKCTNTQDKMEKQRLVARGESKMAPALLTSINRWCRRRQVTWRFLLTFLVHVWTPRGVEKKRCSTQDLTSSFNWKRVEVNYCSCRRWGVWNDKDGEEVVHGVLILCWHADNDGRGRCVRQLHIKGYLVIGPIETKFIFES